MLGYVEEAQQARERLLQGLPGQPGGTGAVRAVRRCRRSNGRAAAAIGVFGGTFDPPHLGHLVVASDVLRRGWGWTACSSSPRPGPPHKRGRVQAARGAAPGDAPRPPSPGDARFAVDDLELRREGASYTVDTLRELREPRPRMRELFFVIGVDQVAELPHLARAGGGRAARDPGGRGPARASGPPRAPLPGGARWTSRRIDLSSTDIRRRVARRPPVRYLVPEAVREIIEREGLYR